MSEEEIEVLKPHGCRLVVIHSDQPMSCFCCDDGKAFMAYEVSRGMYRSFCDKHVPRDIAQAIVQGEVSWPRPSIKDDDTERVRNLTRDCLWTDLAEQLGRMGEPREALARFIPSSELDETDYLAWDRGATARLIGSGRVIDHENRLTEIEEKLKTQQETNKMFNGRLTKSGF